MQVERFLEASAETFPDKLGLVCGERRLTYRELDDAANRFARGLIGAGIRRGDRVVICLENSVETVVAIFGILKRGGVFLVLNPSTKADKLAFVLNDSRAAALVTDARHGQEIASRTPYTDIIVVADGDARRTLGAKTFFPLREWLASSVDAHNPGCRAIDIDLAALIYTSGSSGRFKGVMLTHRNIVAAATSITTYLQNTPDDIILNVLPMSFDYGLYQVLMAFMMGGTVVLERSFAYPHAVLEKLVSEKATGFPIVPTVAALLLQIDLANYDLSRLRYITSTGAALSPEHVRRLRESLPDVAIFSMYGLTECKRVSYLPPEQIDIRPASVGKAMPNVEVYLVDEHGARVTAGAGELVIRGSNVMQGYWELPSETAQVLKPGPLPGEQVLYSGDLFHMDDEGYLYFIGRKDEMIKSCGEKVSPREVENILHEMPGVAAAAVVGVPDVILGQAVKAVVVLRQDVTLTETDIRRYCADRLENVMIPKHVEIRPSLPRTSNGKVDKQALVASGVES